MVSIFNDVIGPVMRGPSSSHCAAALRLGRLARDLMASDFSEVLIEFDRGGSLPTTHESQGSDMGLFGGLLGWDATDERLPRSRLAIREAGVSVRIESVDAGDPHPSTYRLTLRNARERHTLIAVSTGGGMVEAIELDGFKVSLKGDWFETLLWTEGGGAEIVRQLAARFDAGGILLHEADGRQLIEVKASRFLGDEELAGLLGIRAVRRLAPVLPVLSRRGATVPFASCEEMIRHDAGRNLSLWQLAAEYEMARGGMTEPEVLARMTDIVRILRRSIAQGLAGTRCDDRVLGCQSGRFVERMRDGRLLDAGPVNRMVLYVTALMEVKSSMGVIVAAPTAGSCAALPGAVIAMAESMGQDEEAMVRAMLAGGLIGVFVAERWTFAAEVGGCQAECGVASSMAAAALVTLAGGTHVEGTAAASMALQNVLGLICDPVANRVEVPCLGRNAMAATNALTCANMALAGCDPVIPLEQVIDAARRVGEQLPRELRCTALGGLSLCPASRALEARLAHRAPQTG
jgi:L-serine dehydratase